MYSSDFDSPKSYLRVFLIYESSQGAWTNDWSCVSQPNWETLILPFSRPKGIHRGDSRFPRLSCELLLLRLLIYVIGLMGLRPAGA
ncbi:hypothetical protein BGZ63DRAFT_393204 [Mariannaea sp. PMI_226]|nr:hypothetical protein BGZ63DRAFT_393204 [Mariannaea sp. PMI_226]